jgi:hypothetical protein
MGLGAIAQPFAYWLLPDKRKPAYENVDTYFKIFAWSMGYVFLVLVGMVAYAVLTTHSSAGRMQ